MPPLSDEEFIKQLHQSQKQNIDYLKKEQIKFVLVEELPPFKEMPKGALRMIWENFEGPRAKTRAAAKKKLLLYDKRFPSACGYEHPKIMTIDQIEKAWESGVGVFEESE